MIKNCEVCTREFKTKPYYIKLGQGRFCSQSCRSRIIKNAKGAKRTPEMRNAMSKRMKGVFSNEKHWAWKDDKAGYTAIHQWMKRHYGQPKKCDFCLTTDAKTFHWANKSKEYRRIRTDWFRLCQSCHFKYDKVGYSSWKTRRKNKEVLGLYC